MRGEVTSKLLQASEWVSRTEAAAAELPSNGRAQHCPRTRHSGGGGPIPALLTEFLERAPPEWDNLVPGATRAAQRWLCSFPASVVVQPCEITIASTFDDC
ncbi:hypothetical protein MRX96_055246 [Rhipicephalus microplus]